MFQLTVEEWLRLKSQFVISNAGPQGLGLKSQIATSNKGRGGRRHPPYAFTEQGVAMLSSVLRSQRAVEVNIEIMRAFVRLRRLLATNAELSRKLDELEKKTDTRFTAVFAAIRKLMEGGPAPAEPKKRIGFHPGGGKGSSQARERR